MKVLVLNGSPRINGNTSIAIAEMEQIFKEEGIETETVQLGVMDIRGCIACGSCKSTGKCAFDDIVNQLAEKLKEADGLVLASPVYYASANATLIACLDRLFYSSHFDKTMKVGASIAVARRGGCSSTFDELNKYFTICGMPVASSQYWNSVHGAGKGDAAKDAEVIKGPNIKPFPETEPLADEIDAEVILKTGDNITTDHIMPAGSRILPYRSWSTSRQV